MLKIFFSSVLLLGSLFVGCPFFITIAIVIILLTSGLLFGNEKKGEKV